MLYNFHNSYSYRIFFPYTQTETQTLANKKKVFFLFQKGHADIHCLKIMKQKIEIRLASAKTTEKREPTDMQTERQVNSWTQIDVAKTKAPAIRQKFLCLIKVQYVPIIHVRTSMYTRYICNTCLCLPHTHVNATKYWRFYNNFLFCYC